MPKGPAPKGRKHRDHLNGLADAYARDADAYEGMAAHTENVTAEYGLRLQGTIARGMCRHYRRMARRVPPEATMPEGGRWPLL